MKDLKHDEIYENKINCYELLQKVIDIDPDNKKVLSMADFYDERGYLSEKQIEYLKSKLNK